MYPKSKKIDIQNALIAISAVAVPFILADMIVTGWFWEFNPRYILGPKIIGVPIEELLFFFTVPWACLSIWVNIDQYFDKK